MRRHRTLALIIGVGIAWLTAAVDEAQVNVPQQVTLQGLVTNEGHGAVVAAAVGPGGNVYLLLNEGDGVRLSKSDAAVSVVQATQKLGAAGDVGVAMALDGSGDIYVTGTTTSGALAGSSSAAFPKLADSSTNSFVAKFDASLNPVFVTFLGAGRTAATGVAVTADAIFVTGITFNNAFPVTAAAIQQAPALNSIENGFVERLSTDGTTLVYATYLTGADGSTVPTGIVADSGDEAVAAGSTSASGFPTVNALQPRILLAGGATSSGFVTKLNPAGSTIVFSTFVAGAGLSGLALDASSNTLLLSGSVAMGQFPVATVPMPLAATAYQTLLRLSLDGQTLQSSELLTAGNTSSVSAGESGDAWVSGSVGVPLFPGVAAPDYGAGDSFLMHIGATGVIDQTLRFGGQQTRNGGYASMQSTVGAPAVTGTTVVLPGTLTLATSPGLLTTQTYDLPIVGTPNMVLPNTLTDALPTAATCSTGSVCSGSAGLLAIVSTSINGPVLAWSADDLPNVTLRNLGSAPASGVAVVASGYASTSNCGSVLLPSNECSVALSGSGPGVLTGSASGASAATVQLGSTTTSASALALSTDELDFGIVSSISQTVSRSLTVTNLSSMSQTFTAAKDGGATSSAYAISVTASTCSAGNTTGSYVLAAGASCQLSLGLTASATSTNDGAVRTTWLVGARDVVLTGYTQAAALSASATEVDFGTRIQGGIALPRYLYISNNSTAVIAHAAAALPPSSPFSVEDGCPASLAAQSVCALTITYAPTAATATDSAVLTLDEGITVLLTGDSLPAATATGASVNPNITLSASSLTFVTPVNVTAVSSATQTVVVSNTGSAAQALSVAVSGDFVVTNGCGPTLAGGGSCSVLVGFAPSQPGRRQGLLSVTSSSGFAPSYVALAGTGTAILPANNGLLALGQTLVSEPVVAWYKVQVALPSLTVTSSGPGFGVALVEDAGYGHGSLPPSAFTASATLGCSNCWLGVQFLSQQVGTQSATVMLSTAQGGNPYVLTATGTTLPVMGLLLDPITQDFGTVSVGSSSAAMTFTLANLALPSASATVQSVAATGDFAVVGNAPGEPVCSGAVGATASCYVSVAFSPTATGDRSGTLTVVTSAGTLTATLTGYGVADSGLGISPTALVFAEVAGGAATQQTVTLSNQGSSAITLGTLSTSDPSMTVSTGCATLAVGASCTAQVTFTPQASTVAATLTIPATFTVNGQTLSASYGVALSGTYTTQDEGLQILPAEVNYGAVSPSSVGPTRQYVVNNVTSEALNVTLQMPRQFPLASATACGTVSAGGSCTFSVSFVPETAGNITGTVLAQGVSADGLTNTEALTYLLGYGAGSGVLSITGNVIPNTPVSFGQVSSGQTAQQTLTVTNTGTGSLTIHRVSSEPPFLATTTCGAALVAGSSCSVTVTYAPIDEIAAGSGATGTRTDAGTLTLESDAASSPDFVQLSGLVTPVTSASPASSAVLASYELSESALTFANTLVGNASATQSVTLINTGSSTIHVAAVTAPADFTASTTCSVVLPGNSCTLSVGFAPTTGSTASVRTGAVEIASDATDALEYISVLGTTGAASLSLSPTSLTFGSVAVGASGVLSVTVMNAGSVAATFEGVSASAGFSAATGTCPLAGATLAAGASCTLQVSFTPTTAGAQTGTLSVSTDATQLPLTVALSGTGTTALLQVVPQSLAFGNIVLGSSGSLSMTLTNTGTAALTGISGTLGGTNSSDFTVTQPCGSSQLGAGQSCTETVTFAPGAAGTRSATLTLASSDPHSPSVVALSGTGVAAAGSFALTVNGASSATVTVTSGTTASYPLTLTPMNGYTGSVALTCSAVNAAQYASCSLLTPLLTLSGGAQSTTATISTLSSSRRPGAGNAAWLLLLAPLPFVGWKRARFRAVRGGAVLLLLGAAGTSLIGCGSGGKPTTPTGGSTVLYAPAGTYQYQVTASSTNGPQLSSTVTLNLTVQ